MKLYELMNILADLPCGAEVGFTTNITEKELKQGEIYDTDDNGENIYSVLGTITEVSDGCNGTIYLAN